MNAEDIVVGLIALQGGELVGRTRLQKQVYLLHRCGANFDLPFVYHHYGPYSFDLASGWTDARAEGRIEIEERPGRNGILYAIFHLKGGAKPPDRLGELSAVEVRPLLEKMTDVSDIVLELAATIVFLREDARYRDGDRAVEETKARKPFKAVGKRIDKAIALIAALGLEAESVCA